MFLCGRLQHWYMTLLFYYVWAKISIMKEVAGTFKIHIVEISDEL